MTGTETLRWFKSSYSDGGGGNCVEVAHRACASPVSAIHIRDSKNVGGGVVTVSGEAWTAFLIATPNSPSLEKP
ncbi:DUF397 domain-containing protein [Streptomyces sp. NPDC002758]